MTVVLLAAGALVTGTGSGLAVPDWPLSFGQFFPPMVGGVLYEHGHRLIAGTVGLLTLALAAFFWLHEPRGWVRALAIGAVLAVLTQAALGGITVLLKLPKAVSVTHACLAQLFFSITAVLALVTSPAWRKTPRPLTPETDVIVPLPALCVVVNIAFFLQLLAGAIMRHNGAGLAIPDFPLSFGRLVPPEFPFPVLIHYIHRVGALTLILLVTWITVRIYTRQPYQLGLVATVGALSGLIAFQLLLGAFVIWTRRPIPLTTFHLVVGAACLATSFLLTAQVLRLRRVPA